MKALISGVSGQDGSYLAEFLLAKGYTVYGLVRRTPETSPNLRNILGRVEFLYGDVRDICSLSAAIHRSWPDELYNLAGQSFVPPSWTAPEATLDINAGGLARILSIVKSEKPDTKVYQASSSEMFGNQEGNLNEDSPMLPTSPYGLSKLAAHHLVRAYRGCGLKVVSGVLFNHESERRGAEMVTMKICRHVARFACGYREPLELGSLEVRRDWGYAPDYVEAMWLMMRQADRDYVIGTGETHSVDEVISAALSAAGIPEAEFSEKWLNCDDRLIRQGEIRNLRADAREARKGLGWNPKVSFDEMIRRMVASEIEKVRAADDGKRLADRSCVSHISV